MKTNYERGSYLTETEDQRTLEITSREIKQKAHNPRKWFQSSFWLALLTVNLVHVSVVNVQFKVHYLAQKTVQYINNACLGG